MVSIQNQKGNKPTRWDCTGTVVEVRPNDQYMVKVDGSGRLTMRNRKFLRPIKPVKEMLRQHEEDVVVDTAPRRSDRIASRALPEEAVMTARAVQDTVSLTQVFHRPWEQLSSEQPRARTATNPAPAPQ